MIGLALAAGGGPVARLASGRSSHYSPSLRAVVMPRRSILILAASLVILSGGAAAVLAYDSSERNVIADRSRSAASTSAA